jgi:hypothetical protein
MQRASPVSAMIGRQSLHDRAEIFGLTPGVFKTADRAMDPRSDVILAYEMNGADLTR